MGLPQLWEAWEIKFLLVSSLAVQVILLIFTEWRLYVSRWPLLSAVLSGIVWLLYQTADDVAIYVLGHMSLSSKPRAQQQLMAFWASLLLVHLGGQDTITAYSMEDNNLWLRHSFTLLVQAVGAAYVLWKYAAGGSGAMLAAAVFMLVVGVAKYAERIYALYSSRLDSISKSLQDNMGKHPDVSLLPAASPLDAEAVLQGAHDLFHLCKGQFADNKMWPSRFESEAISAYHNGTNPDDSAGRSMLFQLAGMQLSLMRDILYTKAVVIHTRYGCVSRIASIVSIIVACFLFRQSTMARASYSKGDIVVTYVLLAGAFFLEVASVLRAFLSTWTCAWSKAAGWNMLHEALVCLRRGVKVAQRCRKLSGRIGQHDLMELHLHSMTGLGYWITSSVGRLQYLWKRRLLDPVVVSQDVEDLLLQEVERMVAACGETYVQHEPNKELQRSAVGAWLTGGAGAEFYVNVAGSAFAEICAARADEVVAVSADGDGAGPESERVEAVDAAAIGAGGAGAESEIAEADDAAAIGAGGITEADDAAAIGAGGAGAESEIAEADAAAAIGADGIDAAAIRAGGSEQQAVAGGAGAEEAGFDAEEAGFDGTILAWHYATSAFLCMLDLCCRSPSNRNLTKVVPKMLSSVHYMSNEERERLEGLAKAIHVLTRYMVFLLTERPHLLPSPVRRSRYDLFCAVYQPFSHIWYQQGARPTNESFTPALNLAYMVLDKCEIIGVEAMLGVLSQVWVEMLCYAANHCSSDSHARQLNSSSELITVIWILMNTMSGRSAVAPSSSASSS